MSMVEAQIGGADPTVLSLRMEPRWEFIDEVRRFVEAFCQAVCPGTDRESQLALATHELMQNAMAHSETPAVEVKLAVDAVRRRVGVAVSNTCRPGEPERLRERLAHVYAHRDPLASYLASMHEAPGSRGGLGLARVRFEAELELEMTVEGDRLTVHASGPLDGEETQRRLATGSDLLTC
jgi:anti-sigma regulatory factor (Ser/Thr protein kinase)